MDDSEVCVLSAAVDLGNIPFLSLLLNDFKLDVNREDDHVIDALLLKASRDDDSDVISLLLSHGFDINSQNEDGDYLLLVAVQNQCTTLVKLLISQGADINLHDYDRETPFRYALENEDLETVKLLVDAGLDLDAEEKPIEVAVMFGNNEIIEYLIERGSTIHVIYFLSIATDHV